MSTMSTDIAYARGIAGKVKAVVAICIPVAQLIQAAVTDNEITSNEWQKIAIAAVGAVGVYYAKNKGENVPPVAPPIELGPLDEGYISPATPTPLLPFPNAGESTGPDAA